MMDAKATRREREREGVAGWGDVAGWLGGCLSPGTRACRAAAGGGETRQGGVVQNACDGHESEGGWDGTRPVLSSLGEITQGYCSGKNKGKSRPGGHARARKAHLSLHRAHSLPT